ncbi:unnamed protein product, partial [marine sediment metagenome]
MVATVDSEEAADFCSVSNNKLYGYGATEDFQYGIYISGLSGTELTDWRIDANELDDFDDQGIRTVHMDNSTISFNRITMTGMCILVEDGSDILLMGNKGRSGSYFIHISYANTVNATLIGNDATGSTLAYSAAAATTPYFANNKDINGRIFQPSTLGTPTGTKLEYVAVATWDFAVHGGAISVIGLGVYLPDNA